MGTLRTLAQTFRFEGVTADRLAHVLATAPLIGAASLFGQRTARSTSSNGDTRELLGFEPLPFPLLRFDIAFHHRRTQDGGLIVVEFSQPERQRPYLAGQFVWLISDVNDETAAVLREEINTPAALEIVDRPLSGHGISVRRFLFFAGGHARLMKDVAANIRALLD